MVFHFPPISGGGVVVIVELANKFAQLGHDVTILTPDLDWTGEKYEAELDEKIIIHKIETPSRYNLKIAARRVARFSPGAELKKAVNRGK